MVTPLTDCRAGESHSGIDDSLIVFCGLPSAWLSPGHIIVWTVDQEWVWDTMLSQRLCQECACLKDPLAHSTLPLPSSWRGWIGCFVCSELSVTWVLNQDLSALEAWPASWASSWELSQGGLCTPSAHTGLQREPGKTGLSLPMGGTRELFWPPSLPAPGQPVSTPAWIFLSRLGAPEWEKVLIVVRFPPK